ncbi:MAG: TIGR03752 family integrating conjugative element protein [Gammaproteobacteria bacterium]|uniref:TIGR03752 family integrating conjugative element protein n=1 Tax=uncultured Pseudacidovorax sp. TaxID=679313 RepID=UPI00260053E6|nr:TIGR03752 family integrating conjugative element protein [uncultured Pseudacidovorax sp.]
MAASRNKLIPVFAVVAVGTVVTIIVMQLRGDPRPQAAAPMKAPPSALPATKGADQDTPTETLKTVVAANKELRDAVQKVLTENENLRRQLKPGNAGDGAASTGGLSAGVAGGTIADTFAGAVATVGKTMQGAAATSSGLGQQGFGSGKPAGAPGAAAIDFGSAGPGAAAPDGAVSYKVVPPMGYAAATAEARGRGVPPTTTYVRTSSAGDGDGQAGAGPAARAAAEALAQEGDPAPKPIPYFTIPENATLAGVTSMSTIIGRVPVDGQVRDPMQWKAVVGRDNLAANGFELPDDLAGMIISGVAIGDMALSCSEGKVRSVTFVFNDGAIQTVSSRGGSSAGAGGGSPGAGQDLGYVSDAVGNPCIPGQFVTNAPAYITDVVGAKALDAAGQAFSDAQKTIVQSASGGSLGVTSTVTGSVGRYALGQAVAGSGDELSKWLLQRLKNSFDAVVTPAGQLLVVHVNQELRIDKNPQGRRLVHRRQEAVDQTGRGARYGLE